MAHAQPVNSAPETSTDTIEMPSPLALQHATLKALETDRPIMMDYWPGSLSGSAMVGIRADNEKLLVKSASEYTSQIVRLFKVENTFLVLTENSLYLVSSGISSCNISE